MGFIIGRFEKIKKNISALAEADRHNNRDKNYSLCSNIDNERTELNEHYVYNDWGLSVVDTYNKCIKKLKRKPRKDHIMAFELFFGYSPESEVNVEEFKNKVIKYMQKKFEGCPFCLDLHLDETTPHIHCIVIPCKLKGEEYKFCGSDYRSKKEHLYQFQDEIYREIGEPLGLIRGVKGSKAKHKKIQEFYEEEAQQLHEEWVSAIEQKEFEYQEAYDLYEKNLKLIDKKNKSLEEEIEAKRQEADIENLQKYKESVITYFKKLEQTLEQDDGSEYFKGIRACFEYFKNLLINMGVLHRNKENNINR